MTVWERIKQLSEKLSSSSTGKVAAKAFKATPPGLAISQAKKGLQNYGRWENTIGDAIKQTAPNVVQGFGDTISGKGTVFQNTPYLRNVSNMAANTGQVVASGAMDIGRSFVNSVNSKPTFAGTPNLKNTLTATRGLAKLATAGTPFFQASNVVTNLPQGTESDIFRRLTSGVIGGMSQTEGLRSSANEKTINVLGQDIDPVKTAGSMIGYVKNPQNKDILNITGKIFPTVKSAGVLKWLGSTFVRGIFEDLALNYPDMPDNLSDSEKAQWMLKTGIQGGLMEIGGQTVMQGGGELAQRAIKKFIGDEKSLALAYDYVRARVTGKSRSRLLMNSVNKANEQVVEGPLGLIRKVIGKDGVERYHYKAGSGKGGQWTSLDTNKVDQIEQLARDPFAKLADLPSTTRKLVNEYRFINNLDESLQEARTSKMRFQQDPNNPRTLLRMPQEEMMGAMAGVEPYQDENGEWKVKYNQERGILGVGLMAGRKALGDSITKNGEIKVNPLIEEARKYKSAEEFEKAILNNEDYVYKMTPKGESEMAFVFNGVEKGKPGISIEPYKTGKKIIYRSESGTPHGVLIVGQAGGKDKILHAYVDKTFRGHGIGSDLIKEAKKIGVADIHLSPSESMFRAKLKADTGSGSLIDFYNQSKGTTIKAKVEPQLKATGFEKEMDELNIKQGEQLKNTEIEKGIEQPVQVNRQAIEKPILQAQQQGVPKTPLQQLNQAKQKVKGSESLPDIITKDNITVKEKVNILDYLRTPDRVLNKIGLEEDAKYLRQQYNQYLQELPKEIDRITKWRDQSPSKESSQRLFQYLDGQDVKLDANEQRIANEIKVYLENWAERLDLKPDQRIASYITHIFEKDFIQKEFDPEIAKLIRDKVPGSVYDPFLEKRLGKLGYVEDVWRALDAYVKRATRKVNIDPALESIQKSSQGLEESQFDYVKNYIDRVNLRPTKLDNLVDNTIKSLIGYKAGQRPTAYLTRKARQAIYRGTLGLNASSALKNLSQGANTYAVLGEKYTIKGYSDILTKGTDELKKVGVLDDGLIQDRTLSASKQFIQKADKVLFSLFDLTEKINRGSAYYGAKAKALAQGKSEDEAIDYALNVVRDTQFTFGSVDTPVALQGDIAKIFSQFQTFTLKQTEFLSEQVAKKNYAGLLRYTGATLAFIATIGEALGMDFQDIIPAFRFDVPATLKAPVEITKAVLNTPDKYGQDRDTEEKLKDVGKSLISIIPAGTQINKSVQGAKLVQKGYSTTPSGRARFLAPDSTMGKIKAVLFGQYNTPEGREWVDKGFPYLSEKQTKELEKRLDNPESAKLYFDSVMKAKDVKTPSTDEFADFNKLQKKYPKTYLYHSAEKIYSDINKLKKDDKEGKKALLDQYREKGFTGDELNNTLLKIIELDKEGMSRDDRELLLYQGQARAYKIIERFDKLENKQRKRELLRLYKKYNIIDEETEQYIIKLQG